MASHQLAQQLKEVIAEDFGKEISIDEAGRILSDLTGYFDLLAQIHHRSVAQQTNEQDHGTNRTEGTN